MSTFVARPLADDGTVRVGTWGVIRGSYGSEVAARRHLSRRMPNGQVFALYRINDATHAWVQVGTIVGKASRKR